MIVQLEQLNELLQRRIERALKEKNLSREDIKISVNGAKIEVIIRSTNENLEY